ncbi:MAG: hypothetical protein D4R94_04570 [Chitinophagaceae bacterium]|nr:MAG: hypothetical protein D4R94_04570 [Chitinophagaceae bacterium]
MLKCLFCGTENPNEKARFCSDCGPDNPAISWLPSDVDQTEKVTLYTSIISEYYFDDHTAGDLQKFSVRMRERFKISYQTHSGIISKLSQEKNVIDHFSKFRFEFNENVTDAYAGHDTFLDFRYTNLSENDSFKVSLFWDDPETKDKIDFRAETKSFVKPLVSLTIAGPLVFDRIGLKEISDLKITITDQFGESASFRSEPFRFKVTNQEKHVTNNISTHNQISIEGRGVVDATGMGAEKIGVQPVVSDQPRWKQLGFSYVATGNKQSMVGGLTATGVPAVAQKNDDKQSPKTSVDCPPISLYVPSTQQYSRLTRVTDIAEQLQDVRLGSNYWHFLIGGSKNVFKLLIRDLIIKNQNFTAIRTTSSSALESPKDVAAILCSLEQNSLFELDGLDELFASHFVAAELLYPVLADFKLDITIGEEPYTRPIKLDLLPFYSIFYCKDINKIPVSFMNLFHCCLTLEE